MKPSLFIVGQPRSGSTALTAFLDQHPDVFMCKPKEPAFFADDLHRESDAFHGGKAFFSVRDERNYMALFAEPRARVRGEASTNYLYSKVAATRIHAFNPKAKIIILLREPVSFIRSLHTQYLSELQETETNLEQALRLEAQRKRGDALPDAVRCPSYLYYRERARYAAAVRRYYETFPATQIKTIVFEDFWRDNERIYAEVLRFLDLPPFRPTLAIVNASRVPRSRTLLNVAGSPSLRRAIKRLVPLPIYARVSRAAQALLLRSDPTPSVSETLRNELFDELKADIDETARLTGIDLLTRWDHGADRERT
jgi:hypothetical protein